MAGAHRLLSALGNFQSSALFEDSVESEGIKTESSLGSSLSACKKVLCTNSVLDTCDYWLKNDKALCRVNFLEDQHDGGCTICFVSLGMSTADLHDNICLKKLATVSPDLPRLVEGLGSRPLKEHEILLLNGLESPDTCQHDLTHSHSHRAADVCVVQSASGCHPVKSDSLVLQINKFLIGLQSGQERQRHARMASQRVCDDDTNRSVSSIEEDFLTASEHLEEESEDDKNDADDEVLRESTEKLKTEKAKNKNMVEREDSEDSDTICASCKSHKVSRTSSRRENIPSKNSKNTNKESNYASSLAESVLQDAFIHLSQDELSFSTEVVMSNASSPQKSTDEPTRTRTHSFELPKIVIVQSPDNCDEPSEWPGTQSFRAPEIQDVQETGTQPHLHHSSPIRHTAKPVEIALACAASIIGTISNPQVTKQLVLETGNDETDTDEEEGTATEQRDYSLGSAMYSSPEIAGAVDPVGEIEDSLSATSVGLLSAAQASTAVMLHCSVAEGSSMDTFRTTVAEILLKEALEVLIHKQSYTSIANFLETTHNKIVDGIMHPRRSHQNHLVVDDFTQEVAESMFKYALEKAVNRKELRGKDSPNIQCFLLESVNSLLFDVLCATSRKFGDISKCTPELSDSKKSEVSAKENLATTKPGGETISQLQLLSELKQPENTNKIEKCSLPVGKKEKENYPMPAERENELNVNEPSIHTQMKTTAATIREAEVRQQDFSLSTGTLLVSKTNQGESKTPVACFAEDLATTVVSMATELAAICLENSSGKQPWFCALKSGSEGSEGLLLPCRTVVPFRRKETQNGVLIAKKHRAPRLSEIKRKTEEQPELMERLVNRVVDETVNLDDPAISDPFALFASEVTARIMNCPELNVVDTSKQGQSSRSRLQCERWSTRGKAASYESIPEEEAGPSGAHNTLDPGSRLGHNLSRGSSISKQSSCESITDEFSRFMVNQMETEGRGFDLLLDYYAGKNASSILAAAVQQVTSKKNGHLNVRTSACVSKQSSTESITEEFYRYILKDMDKENKDYGITKTKDWSNSLLPPPSRTPFCIRQSSVPDRRSSDSRLTVNSPIKANSFDGFARNVHVDSINIYPSNSVSSTGLCKSDSCLYKRGQTDHITDMLIHETWASSIESLMRKNKIIAEPSEDSTEQDSFESQPHVQLFANRLATDIVESGKSFIGCHQEVTACHASVSERRQGFLQSCSGKTPSWSQQERTNRGQREVPLIHIEPDQKDEGSEDMRCNIRFIRDSHANVQPQSSSEKVMSIQNRDINRTAAAPSTCVEGACRSLSSSSEESGSGGWAQVAPEEDPQEETTCSFIHLSEGNGNSSASSLGVADLEGFPESSSSTGLNSEERLRVLQSQEQADEVTSGLSTAGSSCHRELQVMNFDLEVDGVDREMQTTLQWIAASELGIPALYYRKTLQHTHIKFQKVVHLAAQRSWCVGDLFSLVLQFCRLHSEGEEELGLFDWLLKTQR
ncbi:A-kinase anchor protein SPHKAP isoform X2 [Tachysurus fulvidraco]|uniref:A-kinase anchor protein SPHKAP isoform X2 n=1 Tax=Tachysurus fulvidraco TaxID=1234273 RepID=UPI000F502CDA|nr:A-kinase anchor protein SPHKAP isoform X2 [Tachysurus fulvidraco]